PAALGIGVAVAVALVMLVLAVAGAVMFLVVDAPTTSAPIAMTATPPTPISPPLLPTPPTAPLTPLGEIHDVQLSTMDSLRVDAPGRVGTDPTAFDPIANWDWMQSIAAAWWDDAKPYELSADPIATNGTADLTNPLSLGMTFVSKKCRAAVAARAETATTADRSSCTLHVAPKASWVDVEMELIAADGNAASAARPISKPPCTFGSVFAALEKQGRLTKRPRYSIRYENDVFGNFYRISNGQNTASMPTVSISPSFCIAR
ncbi:MAG: hypothetical protein ABI551_26120, partial [Polyangiaceae bacterium]